MEIEKARQTVVKAGKKLVETGLIARTWGNISCRINSSQFAITPSGRPYETLAPEKIVTVNIEDCSFEGDIEPSYEKGIHAEVYKQKSDINFVIHTHQPNASAVSPLKTGIDVNDRAARAIIGGFVAAVPHGLPGSKTLRKNVAAALSGSGDKAYLMAYHGALCLGRECEEAFKVATELEKVCADFISRCCFEISGRETVDPAEQRDLYVKKQTGQQPADRTEPRPFYSSERTKSYLKLYLRGVKDNPFPENRNDYVEISLNQSPLETEGQKIPPEARIHHELYNRYEEIGAVIHSLSPDILAVSRTGKPVYPFLDDFAQIIGPSVHTADIETSLTPARTIAKNIKGRGAVLLKNNGALCCGPTKSDAVAAVMIMEKGCKAAIVAALFGGVKPINPLECHIMRRIYLTRYSKKASQ